jgi:hypothetical protein
MICVCCRQPGKLTISLAATPNSFGQPRYYLPNQFARAEPELANLGELSFCHACMRRIEDNFRATILYLQAEATERD